jgi:hypothetical protein
MAEEKEPIIEAHKKFAADLFNKTWALYDKKDRTALEDREMLNAAYASAYHWSMLEGAVNERRYKESFPRAEYLISRVNWALGHKDAGIEHARRSLEFCQEWGIGDFDLAFAYEALARAYSLAGDAAERNKYFELASNAAGQIEKKEDRDAFLAELATVPG